MRHRLWIATAALLAACSAESRQEPVPAAPNPLLRPKQLTETAPASFRARFETSKGEFVVRVTRAWAPRGADRFYNLVKNGYYDDTRVYRVLEGFMVQWGVNGDPRVNAAWRSSVIVDDSVRHTNARGTVSFAKGRPHSRTTEIFVNYRDNAQLDDRGFSPFGEVVEGMNVVEAFYVAYGDGPPRGEGPYRARAQALGNAYFDEAFPELDRILRAEVESGS